MQLNVDSEECFGHGRCYTLHPELFGDNEEGFAYVKALDVPEQQQGAAVDAVHNCPESAIRIVD
ncbi:ferredoxin [Streptomyces sp. NPDC051219]|uniref:ferredoxin n=1 Tax=Streptomyces sp. NPDC051219 TaxID=3155283 RepID=UPI00341BDF49